MTPSTRFIGKGSALEREQLERRFQQTAQMLDDPVSSQTLYKEALSRVYSYFLHRCLGNPQVAEDLTQETFMAAVKEMKKPAGVQFSVAWILGIARHKLIDYYRSQEREHRKLNAIQASLDEDDFVIWEGEESRQRAVLTLGSVPGSQRAALVLRYLDGLPVPEVARTLGKSIHATESLLARGRANFKRAYMEDDDA